MRHTLIALAPLVMGVLLTLGVLGLFGVPLNPANMIAFPLILGVGVDNGVHVLHDYLIRRAEGRSTISYAIGRGVLVKALTTMIGFGTLMISSERGLAGLGLILTLGVGCSMLTALVFLPAVLHLLGGRRGGGGSRGADGGDPPGGVRAAFPTGPKRERGGFGQDPRSRSGLVFGCSWTIPCRRFRLHPHRRRHTHP